MERNSQIFCGIVEMKLACCIGRTSVGGRREAEDDEVVRFCRRQGDY